MSVIHYTVISVLVEFDSGKSHPRKLSLRSTLKENKFGNNSL